MSKYFSLIYSGDIHKNDQDTFIPAKEFSELLNAREVLNKAKEDVKVYLEENKKECKKYLEEAKEVGFNQGLTQFNQQILHFQQKMKQIEHDLQNLVLPLALKAAKKIVPTQANNIFHMVDFLMFHVLHLELKFF